MRVWDTEVSEHFDALIKYYSDKISRAREGSLEKRQFVIELGEVWDSKRHWEETGEFSNESGVSSNEP